MKKNGYTKKLAILSTLLMLSIAASLQLSPNAAQVYPPEGTTIPTYAYLNVAPNPAGVGQTVTINFFLATPMETSERPINMTVVQTNPDGTTKTLGPFTGDTTGAHTQHLSPTMWATGRSNSSTVDKHSQEAADGQV